MVLRCLNQCSEPVPPSWTMVTPPLNSALYLFVNCCIPCAPPVEPAALFASHFLQHISVHWWHHKFCFLLSENRKRKWRLTMYLSGQQLLLLISLFLLLFLFNLFKVRLFTDGMTSLLGHHGPLLHGHVSDCSTIPCCSHSGSTASHCVFRC